ncbi:MAG TPA: hypothetical protein VFV54_02805, partial [Thermoanaerobaculia bacterium]|nr:hypothetical protein [Thermoanaerobaculia bacterium]
MSNESTSRIAEPPLSRPVRVAAIAGIAAVFAALRLLQLAWRPPFFDELFTVWIASQPPDHILEALLHDSGPPLYYFLVHLGGVAWWGVIAARVISLLAASALLAAILWSRRLGNAALGAALLLAVFAPHVHFSTEARAYALAGALAGGGCLALAAWAAGGKRARLAWGTLLLVGAAACHYYGVLFFPIPFALALLARRPRAIAEGAIASAAAGIAFLPGFLLASRQPSESIAWMRLVGRAPSSLDPLANLAMMADYPRVFIVPPPQWLHLVALAITVAVVVAGARSAEARRWGVMTLVPVAMAIAFGLAGRNVYFPVRFEAVLAGPFVCWIGTSLLAISKRPLRAALTIALLALGVIASYYGVMTSLGKRPDRWRQAATFVRRTVPESIPIVASGYTYLEVIAQKDAAWKPLVRGFPREIQDHPGWVVQPRVESLAREELPPLPFVWAGERGSAEHRALVRWYKLRPLLVGKGMI